MCWGGLSGRRLSETLGQQVIVENIGGAGGMIGSNRVAKATPDGYQFVLGSRADAINQTLYKHPLYNFKEDLAPVALVADQPMALVARKDLPVDGLKDFIAYVKKNQARCASAPRASARRVMSIARCSMRRSASTSSKSPIGAAAPRCRT